MGRARGRGTYEPGASAGASGGIRPEPLRPGVPVAQTTEATPPRPQHPVAVPRGPVGRAAFHQSTADKQPSGPVVGEFSHYFFFNSF